MYNFLYFMTYKSNKDRDQFVYIPLKVWGIRFMRKEIRKIVGQRWWKYDWEFMCYFSNLTSEYWYFGRNISNFTIINFEIVKEKCYSISSYTLPFSFRLFVVSQNNGFVYLFLQWKRGNKTISIGKNFFFFLHRFFFSLS